MVHITIFEKLENNSISKKELEGFRVQMTEVEQRSLDLMVKALEKQRFSTKPL